MADLLDWDAMRAAGPKVFVGYSDITALHEAFAARLGLATLHGPMVAAADFLKSARAQDHLRATLFEPETVRTITAVDGGRPLVGGTARGVTLGGCLCLLAADLGAPYARPSAAGGLLCLEDTGEETYRIDRYFTQLLRAGFGWTVSRGSCSGPGPSATRTTGCARCSSTGSAGWGCPSSRSSASVTARGR